MKIKVFLAALWTFSVTLNFAQSATDSIKMVIDEMKKNGLVQKIPVKPTLKPYMKIGVVRHVKPLAKIPADIVSPNAKKPNCIINFLS